MREALEARRTAAWLGDDVWGPEDLLRGLWEGAVSLEQKALTARPGQRLVVRARNGSAIPFRLRPRSGPPWLRLDAATIPPRATSLLYVPVAADAPLGTERVALEVEVTNLHTAPGRELRATLQLEIAVGR